MEATKSCSQKSQTQNLLARALKARGDQDAEAWCNAWGGKLLSAINELETQNRRYKELLLEQVAVTNAARVRMLDIEAAVSDFATASSWEDESTSPKIDGSSSEMVFRMARRVKDGVRGFFQAAIRKNVATPQEMSAPQAQSLVDKIRSFADAVEESTERQRSTWDPNSN